MGLTSGINYPRVDAVIASVEAGGDWDIASSASNTYLYQLLATQNVGIFEPFNTEQTALNDYLAERRAGKRLCDYAWRLFVQSL
jgi:hypothetical protein